MKRAAALLLTLTLASAFAAADTIWLKNGVSVKANKSVVKGDQLQYIVGTTTYRIPYSEVDHVDKTESFGDEFSVVGPRTSIPLPQSSSGSSSPGTSANQAVRKAPSQGGITISGGEAILKRILVYERVDDRALSAIENEGNAGTSALAYATAANYEYKKNQDVDAARRYTKRALDFAPDNIPLLCWYSSLLLEQGEYSEATSRAEYAAKVAPESADALNALAAVYYETNRLPEAIAAWKHSLQIRPDEGLKQYVAKAERETAVEENFHSKESSHFTLLFQGQRTGFTMAAEILRELEGLYSDLSRNLSFTPQSTVTVVLYTEKEFFDVTQSPSWASGLNDGKLRIPVKNVSSVTPEFERVLMHELTHSFVHFMTRGRCPVWINEGVAQLMEGRDAGYYASIVATAFAQGKQIPLRSLDGSFMSYDRSQATIAYSESLVMVEYIRSVYGWTAVRRLLESLGAGTSPEEAVREVTGGGYAQLEKNVGAALKAQFSAQAQ